MHESIYKFVTSIYSRQMPVNTVNFYCRILTENKEILAQKKKAYADLARQINITKEEIDNSKAKLDDMKGEREAQGTFSVFWFTVNMPHFNIEIWLHNENLVFYAGVQYNEDGDLIITENEYLEIKRLKELKAVYRNDFDEFKNLKSEVQYCQKLVDQCRQRLIQGKNIMVSLMASH